MDYFRAAFHLTLAEVKPVGALSRMDERNLLDNDRVPQGDVLDYAFAPIRPLW